MDRPARGKRGCYKRYVTDPSYPIPRQTLSYWRQRNLDCATIHDSNDQRMNNDIDQPMVTNMPPALDQLAEYDHLEATSEPQPTNPSAQDLPFPTAQISEITGALLLHSLAVKHGLTQAAVTDVLEIVRLHMLPESIPPGYRSLHRLFNTSGLKSHEEVVYNLCKD